LLVYLLVVAVLFVAAFLAFGGASLLHLQGGGGVVFIILILLIGVTAAGVLLFIHLRKKKQESAEADRTGAGDVTEIDLLLNDANRKLRSSTLTGAKSLDELPLIYLLGDKGAAKTTLVVHSGMEPELLAGTATRAGDADVSPTPLLNLWFTQQAAVLEAGQGIRSLSDPAGAAYPA
jgi:type VI secretion system protein ImpL